jgi:AcrR family transcriptional regulator
MPINSTDTDTRTGILEAAYELFSKEPYQKLSMENIAKRAGVSKALLFYHFSSKEDLARKSISYGIMKEVERFGPIDEMDEETVRAVLPSFLQMSHDRINLIHTYIEVVDMEDAHDELVVLMREMYGMIVELLERHMRARGVRYPREKAMLITLAVDLFGLVEHLEEEPTDVESYVNAILDILGMEVDG